MGRGVVKFLIRGLMKHQDSYFAYKKIFDKIYAFDLVCRLELAFPCLFVPKIS